MAALPFVMGISSAASAAAKTGSDSIVVELTAIFSGLAAGGQARRNRNKTGIILKTITV
jgi:hypothetical protein